MRPTADAAAFATAAGAAGPAGGAGGAGAARAAVGAPRRYIRPSGLPITPQKRRTGR